MNRTDTTHNRIRNYMQAVHGVRSARIKEIRDDFGNGCFAVYVIPEVIPQHAHERIETLRKFMDDPLRNNTVHITTPLLAKMIEDLLDVTSSSAEVRYSFTYEELNQYVSDMESMTHKRIEAYYEGIKK